MYLVQEIHTARLKQAQAYLARYLKAVPVMVLPGHATCNTVDFIDFCARVAAMLSKTELHVNSMVQLLQMQITRVQTLYKKRNYKSVKTSANTD